MARGRAPGIGGRAKHHRNRGRQPWECPVGHRAPRPKMTETRLSTKIVTQAPKIASTQNMNGNKHKGMYFMIYRYIHMLIGGSV